MEKKYRDQLRLLESSTAKEKEHLAVQSQAVRADAQAQLAGLQESMDKLRLEVVNLSEENRRLEVSWQTLEAENKELRLAVAEAGRLHASLLELETADRCRNDQRVEALGVELDRWRVQAKTAQDQIDELVAERDLCRGLLRQQQQGRRSQTPVLGSRIGGGGHAAIRPEPEVPVGCRNKRKKRRKKKDKKKTTSAVSNKQAQASSGGAASKLKTLTSSEDHVDGSGGRDEDSMSVVSSTTTCTTEVGEDDEDEDEEEGHDFGGQQQVGAGCKRLCQQEPIIEDEEGEEEADEDEDDPSTLVSSTSMAAPTTSARPKLCSSLSEEILNYELQQQQLDTTTEIRELTFPATFGTSSEQSLRLLVDRLVGECLDKTNVNGDNGGAGCITGPNSATAPNDLQSALTQIRSGTMLALRCLQSNSCGELC